MKQILAIIIAGILVTACSKQLTIGKKCVEKGDQIHYSYLWIYDKNAGLQADEITCELIDDVE